MIVGPRKCGLSTPLNPVIGVGATAGSRFAFEVDVAGHRAGPAARSRASACPRRAGWSSSAPGTERGRSRSSRLRECRRVGHGDRDVLAEVVRVGRGEPGSVSTNFLIPPGDVTRARTGHGDGRDSPLVRDGVGGRTDPPPPPWTGSSIVTFGGVLKFEPKVSISIDRIVKLDVVVASGLFAGILRNRIPLRPVENCHTRRG